MEVDDENGMSTITLLHFDSYCEVYFLVSPIELLHFNCGGGVGPIILPPI